VTPTIADSGFVVALLNRSDPAHHEAAAVAARLSSSVWLPSPALTEICFVLERRVGPQAGAGLLEQLFNTRVGLDLLDPSPEDYTRTAQLLRKYTDLGADFLDALVIALAQRLEARVILTLDRRHLPTMARELRPQPELWP
jgi:predicted nucleic acid-binding protein